MSDDNKGKLGIGREASVPSAADLLKRAMGGSLARDALKIAGVSGATSELLASIGRIGVASDALKMAGITSVASDALKIAGVGAASDALRVVSAGGLKPEFLASIGKISAASDALKLASVTSAADILKNADVGRLNAIAPPSISLASAAGGARQGGELSPLSDILDATRHLTNERYAVTAPSPSAADSLKQTDGGAQYNLPIARMQVPQPIKSPRALGQLVRQARERMGLTQAAFADAAGVGRRFVSELENGKPTLELGKVMAVCAAAGLDLMAAPR